MPINFFLKEKKNRFYLDRFWMRMLCKEIVTVNGKHQKYLPNFFLLTVLTIRDSLLKVMRSYISMELKNILH